MRQIPILMYHWFRDGGSSVSRSPQLEITPAAFGRQLAWLRSRGYHTVSLSQAHSGSQPLPPRSLIITFDDGTRDFWEHAFPALERHGFSASLFVVTGHVGGESTWDAALGEPPRPLMDWPQLQTLAQRGFEIGSHTHTHRPLIELDHEEVAAELVRSRETLAEHLGQAPDWFAYPRGFYRPQHKKAVCAAGYRGACAVAFGWRELRRSDVYELKRMTIKGHEPLALFRLRLALAGRVRFTPSR